MQTLRCLLVVYGPGNFEFSSVALTTHDPTPEIMTPNRQVRDATESPLGRDSKICFGFHHLPAASKNPPVQLESYANAVALQLSPLADSCEQGTRCAGCCTADCRESTKAHRIAKLSADIPCYPARMLPRRFSSLRVVVVNHPLLCALGSPSIGERGRPEHNDRGAGVAAVL